MTNIGFAPTFTFKQVERALASALEIVDDTGKRSTFTARLQQLQKLGLPWGSNVGRGVKVRYALRQIAEMLFYFDVLDAGVPPNVIATHFRDHPVYSEKTFDDVVRNGIVKSEGSWIILRLNALGYLRTVDPSRTGPSVPEQVWAIVVGETLRLASRPRGLSSPAIVICLSDRLIALLKALDVDPASLNLEN